MSRNMTYFIRPAAAALALILALAWVQMPVWAADRAEVTAVIEEADGMRKQAAALGHEWRYTGKWLKNARAALEDGKLEEAEQLAAKAKFEAMRALEQAERSKGTWEIAVPK